MNLDKLSHFIASQATQPFHAFVKVADIVRPWVFYNGNLEGNILVALAKEVFDSEFAYNNWKDHINSIEIPEIPKKIIQTLEQAIEGDQPAPVVTKSRGKK